MWLWTGLAYHALHFSAINPAAFGFAALFVVQSLMLTWAGATGHLEFRVRRGVRGGVGLGMIIYGNGGNHGTAGRRPGWTSIPGAARATVGHRPS